MATWPAGLPQSFSAQGYSESLPDETIRTSMDVGPDKVRQRSTSAPRPVSGSMRMTTAQIATLETFYVTTTNGGTDVFTFPFRTGSQNARFLKPPRWTFIEGNWDVSLLIEVFV